MPTSSDRLEAAEVSALVVARDRPFGAPHIGDADVAERCCDKGWLEAESRGNATPGAPVYLLTDDGRTELHRLGLPTTRQEDV